MTDETKDKFLQWLEDTIQQEKGNEWNIKIGAADVIVETLEDVLEKYRECKKQPGHVPCQMMDCENITEHYICDDCYGTIGKKGHEVDYGVHDDDCDACRDYPKQYYYLSGQFHNHIICVPCANKASALRYSLKAYRERHNDRGD